MTKIHLRTWEGTPAHPHMRAACSPPWMNDRGEYTFELSDDPSEVTCKACQRSKVWGDRIKGEPQPPFFPLIAHRDADGIVTLSWASDEIQTAEVSRSILEQLVQDSNDLRRIRSALGVTNVT